MNPIDIVIIVIVSFCLIRGFFRGIVKELSSIIGVMGGLYFASTYQKEMAAFLKTRIQGVPYMDVLSYFLIFCGVLIVVNLLGTLIKYLLKIVFLGWADRSFGALFGGIKGLAIISVILIGLVAFLPKDASLLKESTLAPHAANLTTVLIHMVPMDMKAVVAKRIDAFKNDWGETLKQKAIPVRQSPATAPAAPTKASTPPSI